MNIPINLKLNGRFSASFHMLKNIFWMIGTYQGRIFEQKD
jgi:hypothetical protein